MIELHTREKNESNRIESNRIELSVFSRGMDGWMAAKERETINNRKKREGGNIERNKQHQRKRKAIKRMERRREKERKKENKRSRKELLRAVEGSGTHVIHGLSLSNSLSFSLKGEMGGGGRKTNRHTHTHKRMLLSPAWLARWVCCAGRSTVSSVAVACPVLSCTKTLYLYLSRFLIASYYLKFFMVHLTTLRVSK
jgi:hypothetical protein